MTGLPTILRSTKKKEWSGMQAFLLAKRADYFSVSCL